MPGNINCLENQRVRNQQKRLRSTDQPSNIFSSTLFTVCICAYVCHPFRTNSVKEGKPFHILLQKSEIEQIVDK